MREDASMILVLKDFATIRDEVYRKLGLFFEDNKVYFIQKRLEKRMEALGVGSFADYGFLLRFGDKDGKEMQALANLVTTNETYMFREFEQLQGFADHCLPMVLKPLEAAHDRRLRIWSAGCSSGEEPYTLAIILMEVMHDWRSWDIKIKATDIDQVRLEMARRAVYDVRSVKEIPPEYFDRHIAQRPDGDFAVKPQTAKLVDVEHLNLSDRMAMRAMRQFDFIFCRNVLIYFDDASRKAVVDHFYNALKPGGFIFLGHSESIGRISTAFKLLRVGQHLVYRKETV
jgi:chemotaxis protein methyltransferase CheR